MASSSNKKTKRVKASRVTKSPPSNIVYVLGKGTPRLLNARVNRDEIHFHVTGPGMLYSSARILTSLDMEDGATFHAWKRLAAALTCTSYCGHHGKTTIPVEVDASRIGTCLRFSVGPMSMYATQLILRPKKKGKTLREVLDESFGGLKKSYLAFIIPEAAKGNLEHNASIFTPGSHQQPAHQNH